MERVFTSRKDAELFVSMMLREGKVAQIKPVNWLRKTADFWEAKMKYKVIYER